MRYSFKIRRKNVWQLFFLYSCALFYIVFLTPNRYRGDESIRLNLVPLISTIQQFYGPVNNHFWDYYIVYWSNIFGNVILFIPFSFLLTILYTKKPFAVIIGYGLLLSIGIELTQLILRIGVCDIDDIIFNMTGTIAGICVYKIIRKKCPELFVDLL